MRKHSYEFIKSEFDKRNYKLLESEYINNVTKMKYICDKGHEGVITYISFQQRQGCATCSGNIKYSFEHIKSEFNKCDYILLGTEYKNAHTKMKYLCDNGHQNHITWNDFQQGVRCPKCDIKKRSKKLRLDYNYIKNEFEKYGYILLETEYKNNNTKMKCLCNKGHMFNISYGKFKQGGRCVECLGIKKYTLDVIREKFKQFGFILIEDKYINAKTSMSCVCPNGHTIKKSWDNLNKKKGIGCAICSKNKKYTLDEIKEKFNKRGYVVLETEYKGSLSPIKCICSNGHEIKKSWADLQSGYGCKKCHIIKNIGPNHQRWNPDRKYIKAKSKISELSKSLIRCCLMKTGEKKSIKTEKLLGYTRDELHKHLKKQPLYENWLNNEKIDVDHIYPISILIKFGIKDLHIINHLSNLQFMEHIENIKKSNKCDIKKIHNWMKQFKNYEFDVEKNKYIFKSS